MPFYTTNDGNVVETDAQGNLVGVTPATPQVLPGEDNVLPWDLPPEGITQSQPLQPQLAPDAIADPTAIPAPAPLTAPEPPPPLEDRAALEARVAAASPLGTAGSGLPDPNYQPSPQELKAALAGEAPAGMIPPQYVDAEAEAARIADQAKKENQPWINRMIDRANSYDQAHTAAINDPGAIGEMARLEDAGKVQAAKAVEQTAAAKAEETYKKDVAEITTRYAERHKALDDELIPKIQKFSEEAMAGKLDSNRLWANASTGGRIGAALSIFVGGMFRDKTGGVNRALESIDKAIERDIGEQKYNIQLGFQKVNQLRSDYAFRAGVMEDDYSNQKLQELAGYGAVVGEINTRLAKLGETEAAQRLQELKVGVVQRAQQAQNDILIEGKKALKADEDRELANSLTRAKIKTEEAKAGSYLAKSRGSSSGGGGKSGVPSVAGMSGQQYDRELFNLAERFTNPDSAEYDKDLAARWLSGTSEANRRVDRNTLFTLKEDKDIKTREDALKYVARMSDPDKAAALSTAMSMMPIARDNLLEMSRLAKSGKALDIKFWKTDEGREYAQRLKIFVMDYKLMLAGLGSNPGALDNGLIQTAIAAASGDPGALEKVFNGNGVAKGFQLMGQQLQDSMSAGIHGATQKQISMAAVNEVFHPMQDVKFSEAKDKTAEELNREGHQSLWDRVKYGQSDNEKADGWDPIFAQSSNPILFRNAKLETLDAKGKVISSKDNTKITNDAQLSAREKWLTPKEQEQYKKLAVKWTTESRAPVLARAKDVARKKMEWVEQHTAEKQQVATLVDPETGGPVAGGNTSSRKLAISGLAKNIIKLDGLLKESGYTPPEGKDMRAYAKNLLASAGVKKLLGEFAGDTDVAAMVYALDNLARTGDVSVFQTTAAAFARKNK